MSFADILQDKRCLVYCGPTRCNCKRGHENHEHEALRLALGIRNETCPHGRPPGVTCSICKYTPVEPADE